MIMRFLICRLLQHRPIMQFAIARNIRWISLWVGKAVLKSVNGYPPLKMKFLRKVCCFMNQEIEQWLELAKMDFGVVRLSI